MTLKSMPYSVKEQRVHVPQRYETIAWRWMRYSGVLLIPLVWIHTLLQDALVGVHRIDLDYVAIRWASLGWRVYDVALLSFAFAHGVNGLRQVLWDFFHTDRSRAILSWVLFLGWLAISLIGGIAIIGGVRKP
jgi:succinate dehydrogenase / fumarate reductase, membrane anchor subunit